MKKAEAMRRLRDGEMLYLSREWVSERRCYESIQFVKEIGEQNGSQDLHGLTWRALLREIKPVRRFVNGLEVSTDYWSAAKAGVTVETYYTLKEGES